MPGNVTLEAVKGSIKGRAFSFDEHDIFIFGRSPDCHACLPPDDRTASRHHFVVEANPPDACIRDLGSLNGTYVNATKCGGRAATETPEEAAKRKLPTVNLNDGDQIRVGETVFSVHIALPAYCCDCGASVPDKEKDACKWIAGTYICPTCREKAVQPKKPKAKPKPRRKAKPKPKPKPVSCKKCGRDVSKEIGRGRRGDYICKSCQQKAQEDPAALLVALLMEKLKGGAAPGAVKEGREIPGYTIGAKLGQGGMGAVYKARRKKDGAEVALKVMLSKVAVDEHSRKVFQREIEVTRELHHPNCVELYDHGSTGGAFYFALEYCAGGSVDRLMQRRGGKLSVKEAGPLMLQSLEGLAHAHERSFVHRDLKPQNILLTSKDDGTAKVADFGLAKNFDMAGLSGMTSAGMTAGTPPYMPREQLINYRYVKPVSDVWSMGATFYFMLTGEYPRNFQRGRDPMEIILREPVVSIQKRESSIRRKLGKVFDRALADDPAQRYETAGEFHRALKKAL